MDHYILDEQNIPVPCEAMMAWMWVGEHPHRKIIGLTRIERDVRVSTVFLTLDHGWGDHAEPVVFETMVFGGEFDEEQERYTSYDAAIEGHLRWLDKVRGDTPAVSA